MLLLAPCFAQDNSWEGPYSWFQQANLEYEHAVVIGKPGPHQGKVFLIRGRVSDGLYLWDPAAPTAVENYPYDNYLDNMSCGGQSWDGDGNLIISGGDKNIACGPEPIWSHIFKPDEWTVTTTPSYMLTPTPLPIRFGYYYPTNVALHNGWVVSLGGGSAPWYPCTLTEPQSVSSNYWQVFNKVTLLWEGQGSSPFPGVPSGFTFSYYPRVSLLSTGHLFVSYQMYGAWDPTPTPGHAYSFSAYADVSTNVAGWAITPPAWTIHPSRLQYNYQAPLWPALGLVTVNLTYGSAIQWPYRIGATGLVDWFTGNPSVWKDRTLVIGGFNDRPGDLSLAFDDPERRAHDTVWEITDPLALLSAWTIPPVYGAMHHPRVFCNAVITPDLKLIVFGGSENWFCPYYSGGTQVKPIPVYEPEMLDLLNPAAGWKLLSPEASARLYHSIALLLKDGRILVGSGYKQTLPLPPNPAALVHTDAEIFTPPCLEQGLPRPSIVTQIDSINYGTAIPELKISLEGSTTPANDIEFATLIRTGSVTHHFDADQRCIRLDVIGTSSSGDRITLAPLPSQAQRGHFIAPPGYYFLFVVTTLRGNPALPLVRVPSVAKFVHIS